MFESPGNIEFFNNTVNGGFSPTILGGKKHTFFNYGYFITGENISILNNSAINTSGEGFHMENISNADVAQTGIFVWSTNCNKIFKINTSTNAITEWASTPAPGGTVDHYFLTKNRQLLYPSGDVHIYKVDLATAGNAATPIHGTGGCAMGQPVLGTAALVSPMQASDILGACTIDITLFANADASSIWINSYYTYNGYRLDWNGTNYVVGQADTGWASYDQQNCMATDFDNKIYCPERWIGRLIRPFDPVTQSWGAYSQVPFVNNDDSGWLTLGSTGARLLARYSLNTITSIDVTPTPWGFTSIVGQPLSVMGNGGPLSGVGLMNPVDIKFRTATNTLYVADNVGHVRKIDFAGFVTSTVFNSSFGGAGMTGFGVNPAGTVAASMSGCNRQYIFRYDLTLGLAGPAVWLGGPCNFTFGSYPPASGTNAGDGSALFQSTMPYHLSPLVHSNGNIYVAAVNGVNDAFIFELNGAVVNRFAGLVGPAGYNIADEGAPALGAQLTSVQVLQEAANGDILLWDSTRLRRINMAAGPPTISTVVDYTAIAGYAAGGVWKDAYYDEGTGFTYYTASDATVHKAKVGVGDTTYDFTGTTLSGLIRIAKTPVGLLVLQPSKNRILKVVP
jgi:hypothetical protein